jgi:hypothetical protein
VIDTSSADISDNNSSDGSSTDSDDSEGDDGPERPTKRARKLPVRHYIQVATIMFSGDIY